MLADNLPFDDFAHKLSVIVLALAYTPDVQELFLVSQGGEAVGVGSVGGSSRFGVVTGNAWIGRPGSVGYNRDVEPHGNQANVRK
uniref:Uncharacterized protein n=1 Tax=Knipowitschia caucasica TaxID=637954 RepID=A0AAV2JSM7_KNICA